MTAKMPNSVLVSDRSVFHYAKGIKYCNWKGEQRIHNSSNPIQFGSGLYAVLTGNIIIELQPDQIWHIPITIYIPIRKKW